MIARLRRAGGHFWKLTERAVTRFFEDGAPQIAAGISYYGLLSLFPIAIIVAGIGGAILGDETVREDLIDLFLENLPLDEEDGRRELRQALQSVTGDFAAFGVAGVLVLLFAATGLMAAVRHGINAAFGSETPRPPLQGKLLDVLLVLGVGLLVGVSLALTLVNRLFASLGEELDDLGSVGEVAAEVLFALGDTEAVIISFLVFLAVFRFLPARDGVRLRDVWPGALVAAVGYELAKAGFAAYLERFADYSAIYGSLGAVTAFLLFVFLAANVFLLGAEAAAEWPAIRDDRLADEGGEPFWPRVRGFARRMVVGERR